jgi:hypothetical protein
MKNYEDEAFDELEKKLQKQVATGVTDGSKVTIDRAKLEQVLEALEELPALSWIPEKERQVFEAITAIKEALEDV